MSTIQPLKGLPEGVDFVRFGTAEEEDYELINETDGPKIYKGKRPGAASGLIVSPSLGWRFQRDIRNLNQFFPVQLIPQTTVKALVTFTFSTSWEQDAVEKALKMLETIPGFVGIDRS